MSDSQTQAPEEPLARCPNCDFVVKPDDVRCLMCGQDLTGEKDPDPEKTQARGLPGRKLEGSFPSIEPLVRTTTSAGRALFPAWKRPSPLSLLIILVAIFTGVIGGFAFFSPDLIPLVLAASPTPERAALLPTSTPSPAPSETATGTPQTTDTPTITPTPPPTDTPRPPRNHLIESGQTLVGLAQLYGITLDSILDLNEFSTDTLVFAGQEVEIPWPTATPPLQAIAFEIGSETIIVDPRNCPPFYEIQEGDSLFFLAARNDVPLDALLEINFLTVDSILRPGDTICIPEIIVGGFLPPTPGPSPTASPTAPPPGPQLLFPPNEAELSRGALPAALQWLAVKQLAADEWYMIELIDLTAIDAFPLRGFTRASSFQLPDRWQPQATHTYEWRISIVTVTGRREDGSFIYTYGGGASQPRRFTWRSG